MYTLEHVSRNISSGTGTAAIPAAKIDSRPHAAGSNPTFYAWNNANFFSLFTPLRHDLFYDRSD